MQREREREREGERDEDKDLRDNVDYVAAGHEVSTSGDNIACPRVSSCYKTPIDTS